MKILVYDPSGNSGGREGEGTSGYAIFENGELKDFGTIKYSDYDSTLAYWNAVIMLVDSHNPDAVLYENYKLFGHKAIQQSGSSLETPQLLGALRLHCYRLNIPTFEQAPKDKVRVTDPILVHMGILEERNGRYYALGRQTVIHERDAIRHGVFYHRYTAKKSSY